jgi:hypothetical protein
MAAKRKRSVKKKSQVRTRTQDPAQSARFLETAKQIEADESGEAFAKALDVLAPKPKGKGKG